MLGKIPWVNDWENIYLTTGANSAAQFINKEEGKPSGPTAELQESSLMDPIIMDSEKSMSQRGSLMHYLEELTDMRKKKLGV